jgi:hypothetical protein
VDSNEEGSKELGSNVEGSTVSNIWAGNMGNNMENNMEHSTA